MYYSPLEEDYYDRDDRCLHIRIEDDVNVFSYKRIFDKNSKTQYIEEYETQVNDAKMLENILQALHFKKGIVVKKSNRVLFARGIFCCIR